VGFADFLFGVVSGGFVWGYGDFWWFWCGEFVVRTWWFAWLMWRFNSQFLGAKNAPGFWYLFFGARAFGVPWVWRGVRGRYDAGIAGHLFPYCLRGRLIGSRRPDLFHHGAIVFSGN
jgi:hypothetical protein